jgi:hypothetical protein
LSDQDGTAAATESDQNEMLANGDLASFMEMFDGHAAHLFDYCNDLLGDEEEAASATEVTLIAAQAILQDREKIRTWLFALARRECMTLSSERADGSGTEPSDTTRQPTAPVRGDASHQTDDLALKSGASDADTAELLIADISGAGSGSPWEPLPPLSALHQRQREALNLVYRHGIRPDDLAMVLVVPPEEAQALLEAAEADFGRPADASPGSAVAEAEETKTVGVEQMSRLPLAALPPSIWRRTTTALFESELPIGDGDGSRTARRNPVRSQRQPHPSAKGRNRLTVAAATLIPLAAGVAGLLYLTHPSGAARSTRGEPISAVTPRADTASSSPAAASSRDAAKRGPGQHQSAVFPAQPAPGTHAISSTPKPEPSGSASPTRTSGSPSPTGSLSPPSTPSPSPSPSPSQSPSPSPSPSSSPSQSSSAS